MLHQLKTDFVRRAAVALILGALLAGFSFTPAHAGMADATSDAAAQMQQNGYGMDSGTTVGAEDNRAVANSATGTEAATADEAHASPSLFQTISAFFEKFLKDVSKKPVGREKPAPTVPDWRKAQNAAILAARAGHYDTALPALEKLHAQYPDNFGIAADHAAVLSWAGRDADAVAAYQTLPATGKPPEYLIDAIGHSYRQLKQPDRAMDIYALGETLYPDNQNYYADDLSILLETKHNDKAYARAQSDAAQFPQPSEALAREIEQAYHVHAVDLARSGDYKDALAMFADLHAQYPDDASIAGDYVAVLSWDGKDEQAVEMFATLPQSARTDYILDAAGHSYRKLRRPKEALKLYEDASAQNPDNLTYAVGVIDCLTDLGRYHDAMKIARAEMDTHKSKPADLVRAYERARRLYVISLIKAEQRYAVLQARQGHYDKALTILRRLRTGRFANRSMEMDYIAVLSWAGHDKQAVAEYEKVSRGPMTNYALEAVGHSYRVLHEPEQALAVYRRGARQSPRNPVFAVGEIRCLDDLGQHAVAMTQAEAYLNAHGDNVDVLLAAGSSANMNMQPVKAVGFYERALRLSPDNREAWHGLIMAEDRLGAPQIALTLAGQHPGLLNPAELRAIEGDEDARLIHVGEAQAAAGDSPGRFAGIDQAIDSIDANIQKWTASGDPAAQKDIDRARADRLLALHDRVRMQEVVDDYNDLKRDNVAIPTYSLIAVGDAYLYLRHPRHAQKIFLQVLARDPQNLTALRALSYAYLENEQYKEAMATTDRLVAETPQWISKPGSDIKRRNPDYQSAQILAAQMRAYSGEPEKAEKRLIPLVEASPDRAEGHTALGSIYQMRGQPRAALSEYRLALAIAKGRDLSAEIGEASANLALHRYRKATEETKALVARYPENRAVQRIAHDLDVHNMAEIDVHAGYHFPPAGISGGTTNPNGRAYNAGAEIYSAPLDYNWRVFAGMDYAHQREPNFEGTVDYERANAGVEYRKGDVTASVAPTLNIYNGNQRVGGEAKASYAFNDMWSGSIAAALFSQNTPLRALNQGITANEFDIGGMWRQNDYRRVAFTAQFMPFSDNNLRAVQNVDYIQRLYTTPTFWIDAEADGSLMENSLDTNRIYYNPGSAVSGLAGVRLTQTLYHHYDINYWHSLLLMPGFYGEQHYGFTPAWLVRYEHGVDYKDVMSGNVGVNYAHQAYDGQAEDDLSLTMNVGRRF
ncbi:MAG: poly-beta-1,6 N-acetyl-D-glucosamine export porin PgaA [Alphaproteobacteria bacterium]|nr:poly-beta-1,6 N-acetyl-D-glucosamine export porin PgaA [Alphaproteobacteria bacterium]